MTTTELIARMPEDFVELVGRFIADPDINTEHLDVQELMPSQPCVPHRQPSGARQRSDRD